MHHRLDPARSLRIDGAAVMADGRDSRAAPHHRRRTQRGPVPPLREIGASTQVGQDHRRRRSRRPLAGARAPPELRRVRGEPPCGLGMPEHCQIVHQVLPVQLQRRAIQRNPNGTHNPALAPGPERLLLPGPGVDGRIDDRAGLQPSRPAGADLRVSERTVRRDLAICRGRKKSMLSQGVSDGHSMTGLMPRSGNK